MVSSRDRRFVSVEMISRSSARTPPPAFLFPIQRCQRPGPLGGPAVLCPPGSRRRRLSMEAALPCQPARPQLFSPRPGNPKSATKTGAREPRGASLMYAWASRLSGGRCFGGPRMSRRPVGRPTQPPLDPRNGCSGRLSQGVRSAVPEAPPPPAARERRRRGGLI